jgi:hypothetical protein
VSTKIFVEGWVQEQLGASKIKSRPIIPAFIDRMRGGDRCLCVVEPGSFAGASTCAIASFQIPGAKKLALAFEGVNDSLLNF